MFKWVKNFLKNRTARVKLNSTVSNQVKLLNGVPQGSTISPTLFLIFMNDIAYQLSPGVKNTLHADDFAIWATYEHLTRASQKIQESVDKISRWTKDWGLKSILKKLLVQYFPCQTKQKK